MWKIIEEYSNYEICETGNVRNIETGRIVSRNNNKNIVCLLRDSKYYELSHNKLMRKYFQVEDASNTGNIRHKQK